MIILGIDPGIARTGWCVLEVVEQQGKSISAPVSLVCRAIGCIETKNQTSSVSERLLFMGNALRDIILKWRPSSMAIEELFFLKKSPSAFSVAEARGVLLFVASSEGVPVFEYNPRSVKTAIAGNGSADKTQMQMMVKRLLNLIEVPSPDDAADAAAIALCHYFTNVRGKVKLLSGTTAMRRFPVGG